MSLPPICGQPTVISKVRRGHKSFHQVSVIQFCRVMLLTTWGVVPCQLKLPQSQKLVFVFFFKIWLNKNHLPLHRPSGLGNSSSTPFLKMIGWLFTSGLKKTDARMTIKPPSPWGPEIDEIRTGRCNKKNQKSVGAWCGWVNSKLWRCSKENPPEMSINSGLQMSEYMLLLWQFSPGSTNKNVSEFFYWTLVWDIHCTHVMQLFLHILNMKQLLHLWATTDCCDMFHITCRVQNVLTFTRTGLVKQALGSLL